MAKFIVTDVFGQTVIATFASWDHIILHPEMVGKEDQVKAAIERPDKVYEGRTPEHKLFTARHIKAGFWAGSITVAVVQYKKSCGLPEYCLSHDIRTKRESVMAAPVMRVGQFELSYDRDADVLYVAIGSPRPAYTDEDEQGLLIRKDPRTGEVVGVTILDYEEHFRQLSDLSWLATKPLPEELIAYLQERPAVHA